MKPKIEFSKKWAKRIERHSKVKPKTLKRCVNPKCKKPMAHWSKNNICSRCRQHLRYLESKNGKKTNLRLA